MDFDKYQMKACTTAIYSQKDSILYPVLGLTNEAGEVAGKVKKVLRDNEGNFDDPKVKNAIADELGDVLWYLAVTARDVGFNLSTIAKRNIDKLQSRKERGVLQGSGDNR
jgi:NTP pyrophosphatase (non-canonical NTP hydrolase)